MKNIITITLLSFLWLSVGASAQTANEVPKIEGDMIKVNTQETLILPINNEPVITRLKITEMPGISDLTSLQSVNLIGWTRYVEYQGGKIAQTVLTGVEKDGVTIPLDDQSNNGQNNVEDNIIDPDQSLIINADLAILNQAIQSLISDPAQVIEAEDAETASVVQSSAAGGNTGNDQASSYQTPDRIEADETDPVISVVSTTDGCTVRVDVAQGVAIQQSKSITYEDAAISSETECSDTLDRFALVKSYSVCADLIDLTTMTATSQYVLYYVDGGGARNDVTDCAMDAEESFPIVENRNSCTVSLDFSSGKATPQSRLTYNNRNGIETQIRGCEDSEALEPITLIEEMAACSIVHDFSKGESVQYSSFSYMMDGLKYQALPCTESDVTYDHQLSYVNSAGENLCEPIINMENQTVTMQSKTRILVDELYQYITECEPDKGSQTVLATIDTCLDMSKWTHDLKAGISYGQQRYFYNKPSDNSRIYVSDCMNSAVTYPHQVEITGYQTHDDQLSAYQLNTVWIDTDYGRYTIANSAVLEGSQLIPYVLNDTKDTPNGNTQYADNSCDALRLQDKVEIWERPDNTAYNKIIGEGSAIAVNACTAVYQEPVWEFIEGSATTHYSGISNHNSSCTVTGWSQNAHGDGSEGYVTSNRSYSYQTITVTYNEKYKGSRLLLREDGSMVTQASTAINSNKSAKIAYSSSAAYSTTGQSRGCGSVKFTRISAGRVYAAFPDPNPNIKATLINESWDKAEGWYPGTVQIVK